MRKKPVCKQKTVVANTKFFTIEQLHLNFANGEERVFERLHSRGYGAVMIVAITADDSVLLVQEYAAGVDAYELSFPKGLIEKGESVIEAANRELREETGIAAKKIDYLRSMTMAPAYFNARIDIVVARELYPAPLAGDEPEPPVVIEWPLNSSDELLLRSDFSEARSIAALLLVKQWLKKENNNE